VRFLLDTCIVSDFAQGRPEVLARIKAAAPNDLAASVVTEMEVAYGLLLNPRLAARLRPVMDDFFGAIRVLPYDRKAAGATAQTRAYLKRRGRPIGAYDVLIAGTAIVNGLVLVTSNLLEFKEVEGLSVEDWRSRSQG
jgi:tRNA(fMet)-specific endonuclease VapC